MVGLSDPTTTPPPAIDGYRDAERRGLLPVVPDSAPTPLPGPGAGRLARRTMWGIVGIFVAMLVLVRTVPPALDAVDTSSAIAAPLLLACGLGMGAWVLRAWRRTGRRNIDELRHGYTTLTLTAGGFWLTLNPRWAANSQRTVGWDYRGVWVLAEDGTVKQSPDHSVLPPGPYPSRRPGYFELWSGRRWTGDHIPDPSMSMHAGGR